MCLLFSRLWELRCEYFMEFDVDDIVRLRDQLLKSGHEYTSNQLISRMRDFSDLFNLRGE